MNRSDDLEGQIRAVLVAEATTRRVRALRVGPTRAGRIVRRALTVGAVAVVIVGALTAGSAIRALRASPAASNPQSVQTGVGPCAALRDHVLGLSAIITRVDRIEVKRTTVADYDAARDPREPGLSPIAPLASDAALCVVAVSGQVWAGVPGGPNRGAASTSPAPYTWAIFIAIAGVDDRILSSTRGGNGTWPPLFDALPDRQPTTYPGSVIEVVGPQMLRVRLENPGAAGEAGNPVLVEANTYTRFEPPADTIAAAGLRPGDRVAVFFERESRNPTSGAYALSIFQH